MKRNEVQSNNEKNVPIFTTTIFANSSVLSSKYSLLEYVYTSDWKNNPLHVIKFKNSMKELTCVLKDNEIEMDIVCWGGRGKQLN